MTDSNGPRHPLLCCAQSVDDALKSVVDVDPVFMTTDQKVQALLWFSRLADQVAEVRGRILLCADDIADRDAARDPAAWLAHQTRSDAGPRRSAASSRALSRWAHVATGVRDGTVNLEQAAAITHALDVLPADLDPEVKLRAEEALVAEAAHHGPRSLRIIGRRIVDIVDPDAADSREARALDDEERQARRKTYLRWRRNGDGTVDFTGRVSDAVFSRLLTYLEAFTSPRRPGAASDPTAADSSPTATTGPPARPAGPAAPTGARDDRRPYDQRMGAAFGTFLEAVDPARLPLHGGDATTVIVTIDFDALRSQLGDLGFVGDERMSAGQVRRLACQAGILPAVLGGDSQPLDLGRSKRLATPAQRKAKAILHATCQAEGCTVPNTWCECHHRDPWSRGGKTDLDDLVLLCSFHHHRAHDGHYDLRHHPTGVMTFHRRT